MEDWTADISGRKAEHTSGLTLIFDGIPGTDHFSGTPRNYSKSLNPLVLSRLIREGFEAYQAKWNSDVNGQGIEGDATTTELT